MPALAYILYTYYISSTCNYFIMNTLLSYLIKNYKVAASMFLAILGVSFGISTAFAYDIFSSQPIRLVWRSENITPGTCVASGGYGSLWTGLKAENGVYDLTIPANTLPAGTYTFGLFCQSDPTSNQGGANVNYNATLNVISPDIGIAFTPSTSTNPFDIPPTLSFVPNKTNVDYRGSVTFTWNYNSPNGTCTASSSEGRLNWSTNKPVAGSVTFANPLGVIDCWNSTFETFEISCTSPGKPTLVQSVPIVFDGPAANPPCSLIQN